MYQSRPHEERSRKARKHASPIVGFRVSEFQGFRNSIEMASDVIASNELKIVGLYASN